MKLQMNSWRIAGLAIVAGFLGAVLCIFLFDFFGVSVKQKPSKLNNQSALTATPGMDYLEDLRCPKGQSKILLIRGIEDGFARQGKEKAVIRPKLLELPYFDDLYHERSDIFQFRDFDERGVDKHLVSYFKLPPKILSGTLVTRLHQLSGSSSDAISLGNFDVRETGWDNPLYFSASLQSLILSNQDQTNSGLMILPLSRLANTNKDSATDLLSYIQTQSAPFSLDVLIQDDTMVDFIGLALCQEPLELKGTTLSEHSQKLYGSDVSYLTCFVDKTQPLCNPHAGDVLCAASKPLGCYRDGNKRPSEEIALYSGHNFVGGEVRYTNPVRGDSFKTREEASAYCTNSFGSDWRLLSYHEAGGSRVVSFSQIPINTRVWVDVKDQQFGNCWSRRRGE